MDANVRDDEGKQLAQLTFVHTFPQVLRYLHIYLRNFVEVLFSLGGEYIRLNSEKGWERVECQPTQRIRIHRLLTWVALPYLLIQQDLFMDAGRP